MHHLTNGTKISKSNLLIWLNKLREESICIIAYDGKLEDKSLKKSNKFDFEVKDYESMIVELKKLVLDEK